MMLNPANQRLSSHEIKIKYLLRLRLPEDYISDSTFINYLRIDHSYKRGHCIGA